METAPLEAAPPAPDQNGAGDAEEARQRALAAIAALKEKVAQRAENGAEQAAAAVPEEAVEPARPLKKRFGPPANAPREAPKPRKRRSRWETEGSDSKALIVQSGPLWPTDVTLPGGITVRVRHPPPAPPSCAHAC